MRGKGARRGVSGMGPMTGHHIWTAVRKRTVWAARWKAEFVTISSTTAGACKAARVALKDTRATRGRVAKRTSPMMGRTANRSSHHGVPVSSSGGTTSASTMCSVMWNMKRLPSPMSWRGQLVTATMATRPP